MTKTYKADDVVSIKFSKELDVWVVTFNDGATCEYDFLTDIRLDMLKAGVK